MTTAARDIDIERLAYGHFVIVRILGDIDLWTAPQVRRSILKALESRGLVRVVVDLAGVHHIDSSGISALLEGRQHAQEKKIRFILAGLRQWPRRVLDTTRLSTILEIAPSLEEALGRSSSHFREPRT